MSFNTEKTLNLSTLKELLFVDKYGKSDLDDEDLTSIIFLMTDLKNCTSASKVMNKSRNEKYEFIQNQKNWEEKLLEALIETQNFNIILKLGFSKKEIERIRKFYSDTLWGTNLNMVIKLLYQISDNLVEIDAKKLVDEVNTDLRISLNNVSLSLEMHILRWIRQKFINIEKGNN